MNTSLNHIQNWLCVAVKANWNVKCMAKLCKVSTRSLERHFLRTNGQRPKTWMIKQRQELGVKFLRQGKSVKETAAILGYTSVSHFSRDFKAYWGYSATMKTCATDSIQSRISVKTDAFR